MNASRSSSSRLLQARRGIAVAEASKLATTAATASEKLTPSKPSNLFKRLSALGLTGGSVSKTIDEYVTERKRLSKHWLLSCSKGLRNHGRYNHALEMLEWMEKHDVDVSSTDYSLRLDLISKTQGVAAAENYFGSLPVQAKNMYSYGSLLNCYCKELMEDKALALFKEMEKLDYVSDGLIFADLMGLYLRMSKPEKVCLLVEEMKRRKIPMHSVAYNCWMQSYADRDDTEGVERVWQEMMDNRETFCDSSSYCLLASHYIKAGLSKKAELVLKKFESAIDPRKRQGYHSLISLYAATYNRKEVYGIWESLKAAFPVTTNYSYYILFLALVKVEDFEGLIKCFKEWESNYKTYDFRLTKPVIRAYLKQNMLEEAKMLYDDAIAKAHEPVFGFMELFMLYFLEKGQVDQSLDYVKAAISGSKSDGWVPKVDVMDAFLKHFDETKDVESANKFFKILKEADGLKKMGCNILLRTYVAAGKTAPEMRKMMKDDKIEIDCELAKLLDEKDDAAFQMLERVQKLLSLVSITLRSETLLVLRIRRWRRTEFGGILESGLPNNSSCKFEDAEGLKRCSEECESINTRYNAK